MLRQFTRENETDSCLDLARRDGRFLRVCSEFLSRSQLDKEVITNAHDSLEASVAIRSKISLTNEFKIAIALFEIPVSGCTCLRTISTELARSPTSDQHTYPYRCKMNTSPCAACGASSLAHHRTLPQLLSWKFSSQTWSPRLSSLAPSRQYQLMLELCQQWKRVWVPSRWIMQGKG